MARREPISAKGGSMSTFERGDRVALTQNATANVGVGDAGTVTHLNGDGIPGTPSYWNALDGDQAVWVEWDHELGEPSSAFWTRKNNLKKL